MKKTDIKRKSWECTKEEMRIAIIEQAKRENMITYSELLKKVKSLKLNIEEIDHRSIMAEMLGEISLAEDKAGRGMLSALVVHKTGDREPGQGFFDYAEVLGRDVSDKTKCWVREVSRVYDYWSKH
ncbi:MAG: hypothetical protein HQ575_05195 [Candidatus Omnitrophica bacterium]|nr:hypothetical protein [Candidatus Omnitrophota bacterium]